MCTKIPSQRSKNIEDYKTWVENRNKERCIEENREDSFALYLSPLLQVQEAQCRERHSPLGKGQWSKFWTLSWTTALVLHQCQANLHGSSLLTGSQRSRLMIHSSIRMNSIDRCSMVAPEDPASDHLGTRLLSMNFSSNLTLGPDLLLRPRLLACPSSSLTPIIPACSLVPKGQGS